MIFPQGVSELRHVIEVTFIDVTFTDVRFIDVTFHDSHWL